MPTSPIAAHSLHRHDYTPSFGAETKFFSAPRVMPQADALPWCVVPEGITPVMYAHTVVYRDKCSYSCGTSKTSMRFGALPFGN